MRRRLWFTKLAVAIGTLGAIALLGLATAASAGQENGSSGTKAGSAASAQAAPHQAPLDLNSATGEQLEALPGIGQAYSQRIIDGRPYQSKFDLVRKHVIPASTYRKLSGMVVVRQNAPGKD